MLLTIVIFLLILSVLVLAHEAGHFFVAKLFGIKVEEFGFGLPPRIFGKKFGETLYSINWLPIGGFVKLYGEDEAGSGSIKLKQKKVKGDKKRAFFAKPVWQRALVVFAGVFMNFVLAVVIISVLFSIVGVQTPGNKVVINQVVKGSPADKAGIKVGDTILSVQKTAVTSSQQLVTYARNHLGEKLNLVVSSPAGGEARQGRQKSVVRDLTVTPRKVYPSDEGPMGIAISQNVVLKKYPWYQAPFVGTWEALKQTWLIASGLVMLGIQLVTKGMVPQGVAGPIGIAQLTGVVISIGPSAVLSLVSLLSLNLAIINVLPIPALDGGRLLFILIEGIFGKKINQELEARAHMIGMLVLLGLIALITLHDLFRIITGQPILPK
jgi:regulator of sigma E protease